MHARFAATTRIEQAIVGSRLEQVHVEARTIAATEEPELLPRWRPFFESVRVAAADVSTSEDLTSAAERTATLGVRCAVCHEASRARIQFRQDTQPDGNAKLTTTMAGHQWAAARLWEGLIGPSDASWTSGAEMLARAPLTIVAEDPDRPSGIGNDVARVRLLAKRAQNEKTLDGRAKLYGEILATCAHCHAVIRDR